eukprot:4410499-Prymnesium_polylepis.2
MVPQDPPGQVEKKCHIRIDRVTECGAHRTRLHACTALPAANHSDSPAFGPVEYHVSDVSSHHERGSSQLVTGSSDGPSRRLT